jgi:hypothetical protein
MTQKFPWNSKSFSFHLLSQLSLCLPAQNFQNWRRWIMWSALSSEIPNLRAVSFRLIQQFSQLISSMHSRWDSSVAVCGLPNLTLSHKLASPTPSSLNWCTQHVTVLTSIHLPPCTTYIQWWMLMGGNFSAVRNSIMAHWSNHTSSQPSISTGSELELWIVVGSRLCMVEGRYHVTARNWLYPVFHYSN